MEIGIRSTIFHNSNKIAINRHLAIVKNQINYCIDIINRTYAETLHTERANAIRPLHIAFSRLICVSPDQFFPPTPYSLLPIPSLDQKSNQLLYRNYQFFPPTPYSLLPIPYSLFPLLIKNQINYCTEIINSFHLLPTPSFGGDV